MTMFGRLDKPLLGEATAWLNSEPLGPAELRGHVVLVDFWTLTCINWLRTAPHVRAWSRAYRSDGLVVIGVHTPEFSFEHEIDRVRHATKERGIDYPVAVDNDYEIWSAFNNRSTSSTRTGSSVTTISAKAATSNRSASSNGCSASSASSSPSKGWEWRPRLTGAHLVLSPGTREPIPFRVLLDGEAPGPSHGVDVDEDGNGLLRDGRLYQLVRESDTVRERTLEITFLKPGVEAYAFTFG